MSQVKPGPKPRLSEADREFIVRSPLSVEKLSALFNIGQQAIYKILRGRKIKK